MPSTLPAAIFETVLSRLATLFLAGASGDMAAARDAAAEMLGAYDPRTQDELRLAANIISFSFQALEALSQAATPDMPLNRVLRLRSGAVSLSRESAKAERRLSQLQLARRQANAGQSEPSETAVAQPSSVDTLTNEAQVDLAEPNPKIEKTLALIKETADITAAATSNGLTWPQAHEQRQREMRIAASLKRAEARIAAQPNRAEPAAGHYGRTHASPAWAI